MAPRTLPLLLLLAAAGCAGAGVRDGVPGAPSGTVRVRLMHLELAVPGATVSAVRDPGVAFREERVTVTAGADGRAALALAPGPWYLVATSARPGLFGWYGSNPVHVRPGGEVDVAIRAVPLPPPPHVSPVAPGEEGVAGEVVAEDGPVAGASVTCYLDAATQFRGPGYAEAQADGEGRFEMRLSPGRYWLVARKRAGAEAFGPLEVGDAFGFYAGNPLLVPSGERLAVRVAAVRVLKKSGWNGPSTLRTRVSGTIRDAGGRPLAGYRAFLHAEAAMLGKPDFVSDPSGPDGAFTIWVDREGSWYLGARAEIGKAREDREVIGRPRGAAQGPISVRLGAGEPGPFEIVVGGDGAGGEGP